jgi:hypothetical protein
MIISTFETHHLTCSLIIEDRGEAWRSVNEQISASLSSFGITLTQSSAQPSSSPTAGGYFGSPMMLICPRNAQEWGSRAFKDAGLTANTFTLSVLQGISGRVTNPQDNDSRPLLFFGTLQYL